jgi:hypothetical protein
MRSRPRHPQCARVQTRRVARMSCVRLPHRRSFPTERSPPTKLLRHHHRPPTLLHLQPRYTHQMTSMTKTLAWNSSSRTYSPPHRRTTLRPGHLSMCHGTVHSFCPGATHLSSRLWGEPHTWSNHLQNCPGATRLSSRRWVGPRRRPNHHVRRETQVQSSALAVAVPPVALNRRLHLCDANWSSCSLA